MGCVKLHILDKQYKRTELKISYTNKELNFNNSVQNERKGTLIRYVDPNGMDWYEYDEEDEDGNEITHIKWTDYKNQDEMNKNNVFGKYLGKAVVTFDGSRNEKLGEGGNLFGKGAVLATATVYGTKGADDVATYGAYTMSSDPSEFGVVADGEYTVNRLSLDERRGPYNSDLVIENRDAKIPAMNGFNPAYPFRDPGYLNGVFIHRSNNNGWAGKSWDNKGQVWNAVSRGCLLISPRDWNAFSRQLQSVNSFHLKLNRK